MNGNLIMNAEWCPNEKGEPQYFTNEGPCTYDAFCVGGNRTCSVTMTRKGSTASNVYNVPISCLGQRTLMCGYCIRCINADCVCIQVQFYDQNNQLLNSYTQDITNCLTADFNNQSACFQIPGNAVSAQCSLQFKDRITACTFCAPFAYFC